MGRPLVYGADYSVYVRIVRLALEEKQVGYELVPVDVFAKDGLPAWYLERQPFGRIPAFEHDGFRLYETSAICRYIDEAFPGPALQPSEVRKRAVMNQLIALIDAYAYRAMVWDIYVETVSRPKEGLGIDQFKLDRALTIAATCLAELSRLKEESEWLLGDAITLADLYLAAVFGYFLRAPAAGPLLAKHSSLTSWWQRMSERNSYITTEPTT
ncbi:glutathione S-transferase family protein [Pseudaminobacter sp. 19-2017]|uniref:glutathione transferase n=1 Tax=Pseudaminobacter soli (ex Zhang et al. 2022) TaxID=2831468 RepID=A0A942I1M2_9HYPH|nr:glutathione S-transferase family protein [Pseudaminobacter soli]MBS3647029.1 glutathione S-transferase family protein [Pseudaminobacter soli]